MLSFKREQKKENDTSNLWSIVFSGKSSYIFHETQTFGFPVLPPEKEELPKLTLLAYGSSITYGSFATSYSNSYIAKGGGQLSSQAINFGMPGSCYLEEGMINYIAGLKQPDYYFFELGVNMLPVASVEEFEIRASSLIQTVWNMKRKPIFVTGIYPNYMLFEKELNEKRNKYNVALINIIKAMGEESVVYLPPESILENTRGLTVDLLHPSDEGHSRMGENFAKIVRPYLGKFQLL